MQALTTSQACASAPKRAPTMQQRASGKLQAHKAFSGSRLTQTKAQGVAAARAACVKAR